MLSPCARAFSLPYATRHALWLSPASKGKYDEAARLYRRAIASAEKNSGRDHPTVAKHLNNLGVSMTRQARTSHARAWASCCLDQGDVQSLWIPVHEEAIFAFRCLTSFHVSVQK